MKDKDQPIKDIQAKLRNWRMNFAGSGVAAFKIGTVILIVSLIIISIVDKIYINYHNMDVQSNVEIEENEEDIRRKQEINRYELSQRYANYLKAEYSVLEELEYKNGVKIPLFYKYVKKYNLLDYKIVVESNEVVANNSVVKFYYENISEDDIEVYKNALEKNDGYKLVLDTSDKMILKENKNENITTYIIIENNCFTYGMIDNN